MVRYLYKILCSCCTRPNFVFSLYVLLYCSKHNGFICIINVVSSVQHNRKLYSAIYCYHEQKIGFPLLVLCMEIVRQSMAEKKEVGESFHSYFLFFGSIISLRRVASKPNQHIAVATEMNKSERGQVCKVLHN